MRGERRFPPPYCYIVILNVFDVTVCVATRTHLSASEKRQPCTLKQVQGDRSVFREILSTLNQFFELFRGLIIGLQRAAADVEMPGVDLDLVGKQRLMNPGKTHQVVEGNQAGAPFAD